MHAEQGQGLEAYTQAEGEEDSAPHRGHIEEAEVGAQVEHLEPLWKIGKSSEKHHNLIFNFLYIICSSLNMFANNI